MMRRFCFVLLLASLPGCLPQSKAPVNDTDIFLRISESAVVVEADDRTGSGTVVYADNQRALVLTCAHVVDGRSEFNIIARDGSQTWERVATVMKSDPAIDLALLFVNGNLGLKALPVAKVEPRLFTRLYSVAAPMGLIQTASPQLLTSKSYDLSNLRKDAIGWQLTGFILPGSSGGTVATQAAELACVIEAGRYFGPVPISSMGFCIPLSDIKTFLRGYRL